MTNLVDFTNLFIQILFFVSLQPKDEYDRREPPPDKTEILKLHTKIRDEVADWCVIVSADYVYPPNACKPPDDIKPFHLYVTGKLQDTILVIELMFYNNRLSF